MRNLIEIRKQAYQTQMMIRKIMMSKKFYKLVIVIQVIQMKTKNMQQWNIFLWYSKYPLCKSLPLVNLKDNDHLFHLLFHNVFSMKCERKTRTESKVMLLFFFWNKCYHRFWILGVCVCVWWGVKNFNGAKSLLWPFAFVWCLYRIPRIWICEVIVLKAAMSVNRF